MVFLGPHLRKGGIKAGVADVEALRTWVLDLTRRFSSVRALLLVALVLAPGAAAHGFDTVSGSATASCPLAASSDLAFGVLLRCEGAASFETGGSSGSYQATVSWEATAPSWREVDVCLTTTRVARVVGDAGLPERVAQNCFRHGSPTTLGLPASAKDERIEVAIHMLTAEASVLRVHRPPPQPFAFVLAHSHPEV